MLEVQSARKIFFRGKPDEKVALNGMSIRLAEGEFGIIIGSNGAGKSTTLNAISGALTLDSGDIIVGGENLTAKPVHERAAKIARVFQDPMRGTAASMTIAENMLLAELRGRKHRLRTGLRTSQRKGFADKLAVLGLGLEDRLDTRVELLSGGQRQSLSLIMAVSTSPSVLLLDEHTAALDPRTADLVMTATIKAIDAFKLTTLMVTHNMQHAIDFGHRILMLDAGRLHLEIADDEKRDITIPDLVDLFAVKSDQMLLGR